MFLRNHDELDLGRLTEKQRKAVFNAFGPDPQMQLYDRGIRRRLAPMLQGDRRRIELAYSLMFTLPGTPVVRYGDEIGMSDDLSLPERQCARTPMQWSTEPNAGFSLGNVAPWLPVKAAQAENAVAGQLADPDSVLNFWKSMLRLRRDTPELRTGHTRFFDVDDPVLAFTRGDTVLCVFNLSPEKHRIRVQGAGALALAQGYEQGADGMVTLHPNGFAILEALPEVAVESVPEAISAQPA